ncbi:hypothetical protein PVAND_012496 [Polypedilum vanderplanki]|uniref:Protein sleepless n=1 Tax=Polypedilum vanderplanki TaxID=319348 RepID=A0A9J6CMN1_POLVA|nr:hypothetical protein PVAND_012496 [Polypedilum vanderplanki]
MKKAFLLLLVFGSMVFKAYGLLCYACDETVVYPTHFPYDRCGSKKNFTTLKSIKCPELTQNEIKEGVVPACYKLERSTLEHGPFVDIYIYQRGCTRMNGDNKFCDDQMHENPENSCYLCKTNLCNSATDMQILRILLFFVAIIIVLYMQDQHAALLCFTCENHPKRYCNAVPGPLGPRPMLATTNCPRTPDHEYAIGARAYCFKTVKDWQTDANMSATYNRGCTIVGGYKDFCAEEFQKDPEVKCYLCKTDWCNQASQNPEVLRLLIAVLIFINIMYFNNYIGFINLW